MYEYEFQWFELTCMIVFISEIYTSLTGVQCVVIIAVYYMC